MRIRNVLAFLFLCPLLPAFAAKAQDAPRPEVLVQAWAAAFRARATDLSRIELRERSRWVLDGPFGVRRTRMVANVTGGPDVGGWERDPVRVEVDGRRVALRRWRDIDDRRRDLMGSHTETASREILQLALLLEKLRPADRTRDERIDGVETWRVELVPRARDEALQRYTLWFDRTQGHLLRTRAVVRAERSNTPFFVTTTYTRVDAFDVPSLRRIEGTTQTKRRLRTYTLLFEYEAQYDQYRFIHRQ